VSCPDQFPIVVSQLVDSLRCIVVTVAVVAFHPTDDFFYAKYILPMEYLVALYIFIASRADIRHIIFECVVLFLSAMCETSYPKICVAPN